jgi:hypothetical protein
MPPYYTDGKSFYSSTDAYMLAEVGRNVICEVTIADFEKFINATGYKTEAERDTFG